MIDRFVVSMVTASVLALGVIACGDANEPASTTTTQAQSSTTTQAESSTTTEAQSSAPNAADFLGATLTTATAGEPGAVVQSVEPDSMSRLKAGDVIVAFNGKPIASAEALIKAVGTPGVLEQFTIRVVRGSHRFTLSEVQTPTAYLGAEVADPTAGDVKGAVVHSVAAHSPAAMAGLQRGDVITALDDTPVGGVDELLEAIGTHAPGDTVTVSLSRGSRQLDVDATLADRPAP